jgi:hypothetical protein
MLLPLRKLLITRAAHLRSAPTGALLVIREVWPQIRERSTWAAEVEPHAFKKGRLVLACGSLLQARELSLHREEMMGAINVALRPRADLTVRDIDFEVRV